MCAQDHEADRQYQRYAQALCGEQEERAYFHQPEDKEEADLAAFRKDDRQVGQAAEYPEAAIHQTERQGVPSDHINGTKGRQERGTMICSGGDPYVSAKAAGHSKETKAQYYKKVSYKEAQESFARHHPAFVEEW